MGTVKMGSGQRILFNINKIKPWPNSQNNSGFLPIGIETSNLVLAPFYLSVREATTSHRQFLLI
jgi:hypothetical protein